MLYKVSKNPLKFGQFTLMFCRVRHRERKKNGSYVPYDPFFHFLANQDIIVFYRCRCRAVAVLFFSTPKKTRKGDISTSYSSIQYSILVYFRSFGTERLPKGKKVQTQRKGFIYFFVLVMSHILIGFK